MEMSFVLSLGRLAGSWPAHMHKYIHILLQLPSLFMQAPGLSFFVTATAASDTNNLNYVLIANTALSGKAVPRLGFGALRLRRLRWSDHSRAA